MRRQMRKHHYKKAVCLIGLAAALALASLLPVSAEKTTEEQLAKTGEAIEALRQQSEEAAKRLEAANEQKSALSEKLDALNESLLEVQQALDDIETQIEKKDAQLAQTKQELADMEEKRQEQYEAMKVRIRFMYEHSDSSMLESLLGASSMSDFLNRVEYFSQVVSYDREQLFVYQELLAGLEEKQALYEEQREEMVALRAQQQEQYDKLSALIADTREDLEAAGVDVASASAALDDIDGKLQEQLAYEEALEAQKAAEDQARMDEIKKQEEELERQKQEEAKKKEEAEKAAAAAEQTGGGADETEDQTDASGQTASAAGDLELLAALIQCEADGEPYEGKLAVGSVVMNRVASGSFPNTVMGVIYQDGQFSPVASGRFAARLAAGSNSTCYQAAKEVLNGNITVPYLYFCRDDGTIDGYVIGNHVFY